MQESSFLAQINSPDDLKKLKPKELNILADEIRKEIVNTVSNNGGHLASSLGVVELSIALHRVFNSPRDKIVWDTGHQCYAHKLLTGRYNNFSTLRKAGGISGFPKNSESPHDAFNTGHASTSISAALGLLAAERLLGGRGHAVAVIGDGALTGGLAYEGLADAGHSGEPLIVVLNDNGMSITKSEGAMARLLTRLRLKPSYFGAKRRYHKVMKTIPFGKALDKWLTAAKDRLRGAFVPGSFFEQLGFVYLGPADGHNIEHVEFLLRQAASMARPVLLHAITVKGKGYPPAEVQPSLFHGVSSFELSTGDVAEGETTFSSVFGQKLTALARADERICAVTAAMCHGTGLLPFMEAHPERFFDVGIAEGHAVTMAAAMAKQGLRPVCAIYSTFLQRSYDNILHDTAIESLPVVFAVDRAGLVGEDGETHQGIFDPVFLGCVPGLTLFAPASYAELEACLTAALDCGAPAAVRYPRGQQGGYTGCRLEPALLRAGEDATIVTYGIRVNEALDAAALLGRLGVSAGVVKITRLAPLDTGGVLPLLSGKVYLLEDNRGVLPLSLSGTALNTGNRFVPHGTIAQQMAFCGIDGASVAARIARDFGKA
jgi:1-deoxy-D-xylulose-5-phosphate synthase